MGERSDGRARRRSKRHYLGCLLGGAVGDALGAPVEFDTLERIRARFGPAGVRDLEEAFGRRGAITDDTQMTLFTAEALVRGHNRWLDRGLCSAEAVATYAYLRWLDTQGEARQRRRPSYSQRGWLVDEPRLRARRAPGSTCLAALKALDRGERPENQSKGCGGLMRVAPVGLFWRGPEAFEKGASFAGITHGHPTGRLAAGTFALVIAALAEGASLHEAIAEARDELRRHPGHEETLAAVDGALDAAVTAGERGGLDAEAVEALGAGWVAEEALAIALACALASEGYEAGVLLAVNHGGDSDSTGSLCGQLLGLLHGARAIPERWLGRLELRDVIEQVACDLWIHFGEGEKPEWARFATDLPLPDGDRYPPN